MERALVVDGSVGRTRRVLALRRLLDETGVLIGLVVVALLFGALIGPQFFRAANLELVARQTVIVCVAALGMTMVIVSGGIDLSVGSSRNCALSPSSSHSGRCCSCAARRKDSPTSGESKRRSRG